VHKAPNPSSLQIIKVEKTMIINQLIAGMVSSIVHEIQPEKIYLFGSAARGQMNDDSDIDLMIVESEPFDSNRSRHDELKRIRRTISSYHAPKDILVYSQDEVKKWQHSINHVIGRCVREGRLLYARS
jgi:predicted nucleotidyltransferase